MTYLRVVNWEKYQHYKDRTPPWIKLHAEILNDYKFACLQDASKSHLILIWVLASQLENKIPNDPRWVKNKIGATEDVDLKSLVDKGFLDRYQDASAVLAECSPETETETEGDYPPPIVPPLPVKKQGKRIKSIEEIENHSLDGHYRAWFEENCPLVDRYKLREELVLYCRSKGKRYSDYWATLQTWGNRRQKDMKNEPKRKYTDRDALSDVLAEIYAEPGQASPDSPHGAAMLRDTGHLRQISGAVENPDADHDRGFEPVQPEGHPDGVLLLEADALENSNPGGDYSQDRGSDTDPPFIGKPGEILRRF